MLNRIGYLLILAFGFALGASVTYVCFYDFSQQAPNAQERLESVLAHSNSLISDDNYSCDGKREDTVGSVVASIIELNQLNKVNMLTYGCYTDTCTISVSTCKPCQDSECSSRFLRFAIDGESNIKPDTFTCLDIP